MLKPVQYDCGTLPAAAAVISSDKAYLPFIHNYIWDVGLSYKSNRARGHISQPNQGGKE